LIQNSKFPPTGDHPQGDKIQNSRRGFTLIEILVAIAIVGVLASAALVNFGKNDDQDVRMEREQLTSFLRDVQNKALTGEIVTGVSGVCGFGVHYDSSDDTKIQAYYTVASPDCSSGSKTYGSDLPDVFYFRNGVTVSSFPDVFFLIPNGEVYNDGTIMDPDDPTTFAIISLSKGSVTINPAVTIDAAGNIK
jgi:prepilin-type N-terminal cleavage/methylation domain-containing protein